MRWGAEFFTAQRISSRQLWTDLFYFIFLPFSSSRNEKRDSFYTAKCVSSRVIVLPIHVALTMLEKNICLSLCMFVTLCWTKEDVRQNCDFLWWFVTVLAIFFVIFDEISNILCESQTQIKIWYCSIYINLFNRKERMLMNRI